MTSLSPSSPPPPPGGEGRGEGRTDAIGRSAFSVNDRNGFVFVDHRGAIMPSGFLPLSAGNVRTDSLVETYRAHPLFRHLRNPDGFHGRCEYRTLCGGSRVRAYAMTGDYLGEDPCCLYQPGPPDATAA